MKNLKRTVLIFLLFFIYCFLSVYSYSSAVSFDIASHVFRLHVIANSNSEEDQALKYKVRDALVDYMNSFSEKITTKEEAICFAKQNKEKLQNIAKTVIEENGFPYTVNLTIGNFSFPSKSYGDVALPAGFYDALRVEIGNASGQNWWCVLFPTLCFVDVASGIVPEEEKKDLQSNLSEEDYALLCSETAEYKIKFKLVELFENAKMLMAKK